MTTLEQQISSYASYKPRTPVEGELLNLLRGIAVQPDTTPEVPELTTLINETLANPMIGTIVSVVMHEDRHSDTVAYVFCNVDRAIEYAQGLVDDNGGALPREDPVPDEWIFLENYSEEGGSVWVVESEVR